MFGFDERMRGWMNQAQRKAKHVSAKKILFVNFIVCSIVFSFFSLFDHLFILFCYLSLGELKLIGFV